MNAMRLKPAMKYQLKNGLLALGMFFSIIILAMLVIPALISIAVGGNNLVGFHFNGMGFGSIVMFFVLGIVMVRENIKFLLQNGCGRRTIFTADVLSSLTLALVMALLCVLLSRLVGSARMGIEIGLDEVIFQSGGAAALPVAQSALLRFCGLILTWRAGMFISMVYYRLNRAGQVIVSIGVPALLVFGLPFSATRGLIDPAWFGNAFSWLIASPYHAMLAALLIALLFTLFSWLLLRRAQVKE